MEKINVAELLKDCPKGMELYCTMFENVTFARVDMSKKQFPIEIVIRGKHSKYLTKEGCFHDVTLLPDAKCVIFPKGKTTWEGFTPPCKFKDGDVVVAEDSESFQLFLLKHLTHSEDDNDHNGYCYFGWDFQFNSLFEKGNWGFNRLATEEEKQKLFDAIKSNGYHWNAETKTLENLVIKPKFKVGDIIVKRNSVSNSWIVSSVSSEYYGLKLPKGIEGIGVLPVSEQDDWELLSNIKPKFKVGDTIQDEDGYKVKITEVNLEDECYRYESIIAKGIGGIAFSNQNNWKLVPNIESKFKVGDRIKYIYFDRKVAKVVKIHDKRYELDNGQFIEFQDENAYEISHDKFDITTLKPFDKVLVRCGNNGSWTPQFFAKYKLNSKFPFECTYNSWSQCIPYEGNEHLLGTTNDCDEYYKTWK